MSRSNTPDLQRFVDRLTTRSVLDEEEQRAILDLPTHMVEVRSRQDFVHIYEEVSYSCFISSGLVGRFSQTASGARQITAFHIPGDMADLHSAVRPVGVGGLTALYATTILRIPHVAIRQLAARYPAVAEALWRDCMLDAAILVEWAVNVGRRNARTRLAHIFCEMGMRFGGDREALCKYDFAVTQEQLADAASLTSVHVNRSLKSLSLQGLVTFTHGTVDIHDWDGLAAAGEFDPVYLVADIGRERQKRLLAAA